MKQQFSLAPIFKDNMVFQEGKPIRVFGTCKKGITINVSFLKQTVSLKTKSTTFLIELKSVKLQEQSFSFKVFTKSQEQIMHNCLIGDVYLFMGGPNISRPYISSQDIYNTNSNIRILNFNKLMNSNFELETEIVWEEACKSSIKGLSELSYLFSKELQRRLMRPIGIIVISQNEASIFSWLTEIDTSTHLEIDKYLKSVKETKMNSSLFAYKLHGIIEKIIPLSIKSIILYQGEKDSFYPEIFKFAIIRLIKSYRLLFKDSSLPFIIIQISGYNLPKVEDENIVKIREIQSLLLDEKKNIYLVSAIDLPDINAICKINNSILAQRIINVILEKLFNQGENSLSPVYDSYKVQGNSVIISTKFNSLSLVSKSKKRLGFTYSSDGITFVEAKNVGLNTNSIIINERCKIKKIRYAYKKNLVCDIFSTNGLPLLPFSLKIL